MGVDINTYAVWGVRIEGIPQDLSDAYDKVYENCDLDVIIDGMNGEYMIFGEQLFNGGNIRWGMEDGDECKQIDITTLPELEKQYKEAFCKQFPQFKHYMDQPFRLILFTHYH